MMIQREDERWKIKKGIFKLSNILISLLNKYLSLNCKEANFGCHIDAAEQQRPLNFESLVSD